MAEKPVELSYSFYNVPVYKQRMIKDIVEKNIDGKLDAYLKKVYTKKDAEVRVNYKIQRNKQWRYEAKFLFDCDGQIFTYGSKVWFKYVEDLVNHAFKHFKESLSK
jgi:hypothetical protein